MFVPSSICAVNGRCIEPSIRMRNVGRSFYHLIRDLGVACNLAAADAEVQERTAEGVSRRSGTIPDSGVEVDDGAATKTHARRCDGVHHRVRRGGDDQNGVLSKDQIASVKPYLGDYGVLFAVAKMSRRDQPLRTREPGVRLSLDESNQLRVRFYIDMASAQLDDELGLLGFGCHRKSAICSRSRRRSRRTKRPPNRIGCLRRVSISMGQLSRACMRCRRTISNSRCSSTRAIVGTAQLRLLKRVQADKVVVEDKGVQRTVKVRPKAGTRIAV
jgi:hypothetical protein